MNLSIPTVRAGHLYAVLSFAMGALVNACVKGLHHSVPLNQIMAARFLFGLIFIYPLIRRNGGIMATFASGRKKALLSRALLGLTWIGLSYYGVRHAPLGPATAIFLSAPLFVTALAAPIIKERVNGTQWLAVFIGFCGMMLVINPFSAENHIELVPAILMIIASIAAAISNLQVRDLTKTEKSITIISWYFVIALVPNLILLIPSHNFDLSLQQCGLLLGIGLSGILLMYTNTQAYKYLPAASVAAYEYTGLLWAGLLGFAIWQEVPTSVQLVGGVIIVLSGWLATRTTKKLPK